MEENILKLKKKVLVAVILLIECCVTGATAGAAESAGSGHDQDTTTNVADLECNETVHWIFVDPEVARGLIPAGKKL